MIFLVQSQKLLHLESVPSVYALGTSSYNNISKKGIYIIQNTMVKGWGMAAGEKRLKMKNRGKKLQEGKKNGGKLHKKRGKGP